MSKKRKSRKKKEELADETPPTEDALLLMATEKIEEPKRMTVTIPPAPMPPQLKHFTKRWYNEQFKPAYNKFVADYQKFLEGLKG